MVKTKIRLIILFAAKDGEALYSQQKQYPAVDVTGDRSKVQCCKDLDYHDIEWLALEMDRDHSVIFEIASKYCSLKS